MKSRVSALGAVVIALGAGVCLYLWFSNNEAQSQARPPVKYSQVPQVISSVPDLEIVESGLLNEGTSAAVVKIEVKNNSDKSIIAMAVESGDEKDASGINVNGIRDGDDSPSVVAQPHETIKVDFPLSNVLPGHPVRIGGVIYADGTEAGDERTLKSMRGQREYRQKKGKEDPR